jgi:ParB family chromosome partitioning protein
LGDIESLAASIKEHGLLHPIVVASDGELIAGERRIAAFRLLGRKQIPVRVINLEHVAFGEQAENIDRKDFTVEERLVIGEKIEALLAGRQGARTDLGKAKLVQNL